MRNWDSGKHPHSGFPNLLEVLHIARKLPIIKVCSCAISGRELLFIILLVHGRGLHGIRYISNISQIRWLPETDD